MIKVIDDKHTILVEFKNDSNEIMSGELLTYEIFGEACVKVNEDRIWVPFSYLTEISQNKILMSEATIKNYTHNIILREPKALIVITITILTLFLYYSVRYHL